MGGIYKFRISSNETGDLGRVGKIGFGHDYGQMFTQHYLTDNLVDDYKGEGDQKYDVITFGDSFSQRGIYGYQNYLAHIRNERVLNVKVLKKYGPEQTALIFLNSGLLANLSPKVVIVEIVERHFIAGLLALNINERLNISDIQKYYQQESMPNVRQVAKIPSNNLYETLNWIRLSTGFKSPVKKVQLRDTLFNVFGDKLYFFRDDLKRTQVSESEKKIVFPAIDSLKQKFEENGIQFIYVVAADKYDVYEPFIVNNPYPRNKTLDSFKHLDTTTYFINTKRLLQPAIEKGMKDVYLANDTHWSYIAYELLAHKIASLIKPEVLEEPL